MPSDRTVDPYKPGSLWRARSVIYAWELHSKQSCVIPFDSIFMVIHYDCKVWGEEEAIVLLGEKLVVLDGNIDFGHDLDKNPKKL